MSRAVWTAPRDWDLSTTASGWKGGMHETQYGGYYKQAYWFVPELETFFWDIWHLYVEEVQRTTRPCATIHLRL